jgi:hypothetical protein
MPMRTAEVCEFLKTADSVQKLILQEAQFQSNFPAAVTQVEHF